MIVSDCCGYPIGDIVELDYGICPECKEHCEFVDEEEDEDVDMEIHPKEQVNK